MIDTTHLLILYVLLGTATLITVRISTGRMPLFIWMMCFFAWWFIWICAIANWIGEKEL